MQQATKAVCFPRAEHWKFGAKEAMAPRLGVALISCRERGARGLCLHSGIYAAQHTTWILDIRIPGFVMDSHAGKRRGGLFIEGVEHNALFISVT